MNSDEGDDENWTPIKPFVPLTLTLSPLSFTTSCLPFSFGEAVADDGVEGEPPVVHGVAQGVSRFEEPRALDEDERRGAAEEESRRDLPRLALATDAEESYARRGLDRGFPLADGAVRDGDDVRDA